MTATTIIFPFVSLDKSSSLYSWALLSCVVLVLAVVANARRRQYNRENLQLHFQRASKFRVDAPVIGHVDTIVIGSGPGGCTCANLLSQQGQRVLVLEQHPTSTGGGTHSFRMEGCEWDTGLHYSSAAISQGTTRPGTIMDYMSMGKQHFRQFPEPYDEIVFADGKSYGYMNGRDRTVETILSNIVTGEELKDRTKVYMEMYHDIHQGFVALGLSKVLPWWLQFLVKSKVDLLRRYAAFTVNDVQYAVFNLGYTKEELLSSHPCHRAPPSYANPDSVELKRLKAILAHPIGDYGVQPRDASFAAHGVTAEHYMEGGSYTVGPTQNISINLISVIQAYGGEALVDATVRNIIVENGKAVGVRVSSTTAVREMGDKAPMTEIRAKNIVAATSVYNTYDRLLPKDLDIVKMFHDPSKRTIRQSNGHNFVFCKLRGDPDELNLPDHNVWYFENDLDSAYDEFYAHPSSCRPPVVYIGFPCTKDPTWKKRFPGISNCIVISDGLYKWFEKWADKPVQHRGPEYEALKQKLADKLLKILYESVPQTRGKVEFSHLATPLTEESWLGSYRGGAYDTLCTPEMFATMNQKWMSPRTSIPGLFLAGSSAFFPGLTGAMYGGCLAACNVLGLVGTANMGFDILGNLVKRLREDNPKLTWLQAVMLAVHKFMNE